MTLLLEKWPTQQRLGSKEQAKPGTCSQSLCNLAEEPARDTVLLTAQVPPWSSLAKGSEDAWPRLPLLVRRGWECRPSGTLGFLLWS